MGAGRIRKVWKGELYSGDGPEIKALSAGLGVAPVALTSLLLSLPPPF